MKEPNNISLLLFKNNFDFYDTIKGSQGLPTQPCALEGSLWEPCLCFKGTLAWTHDRWERSFQTVINLRIRGMFLYCHDNRDGEWGIFTSLLQTEHPGDHCTQAGHCLSWAASCTQGKSREMLSGQKSALARRQLKTLWDTGPHCPHSPYHETVGTKAWTCHVQWEGHPGQQDMGVAGGSAAPFPGGLLCKWAVTTESWTPHHVQFVTNLLLDK